VFRNATNGLAYDANTDQGKGERASKTTQMWRYKKNTRSRPATDRARQKLFDVASRKRYFPEGPYPK